jgi:hypothetical protein
LKIILEETLRDKFKKPIDNILIRSIENTLCRDFEKEEVTINDIRAGRDVLGEKIVEVSVNNQYRYFVYDKELVSIFWR